MKQHLTLFGGLGLNLLFALYLVTYFGLNSSPVLASIQQRFDSGIRPGAIAVKGLQIKPLLWKIRALGVVISQSDGQKVIDAPIAESEIDLTKSDLGRRKFYLKNIRIRDFYLLLEWTKEGFHFVDAFKSGRPPSKKPKTKKKLVLDFRNISLENGIVELRFPKWRIRFGGVHIAGEFSLGPQLHIRASIVRANGNARLPWLRTLLRYPSVPQLWKARVVAKHGVEVPFTGLALKEFLWRKNGFAVDQLRLAIDRSSLRISGQMDFDAGIEMTYSISSAMIGPNHPLTALSQRQVEGDVDLKLSFNAFIPSPLSVAKIIELTTKRKTPPLAVNLERFSGKQLKVLGLKFRDLALQFKTALALNGVTDQKVLVRDFKLTSRQGGVEGDAEFEVGPTLLTKNKYRISTVFKKLQLSHIVKSLRKLPQIQQLKPLAGLVSGTLKLSGVIDCSKKYCVPPTRYIPRAPRTIKPNLTIEQPKKQIRLTALSTRKGTPQPRLSIDWSTGEMKWWIYQGMLGIVKR